MKNFGYLSVSLLALLMASNTVPVMAQTSMTQIVAPKMKETDIEAQTRARLTTAWATRVHNVMYKFAAYEAVRAQLLRAQQKYELQQQRYRDMMACNVKNLTPYFKQPQQVWQNLTNQYDTSEKKLAIQINSSDDTDAIASIISGLPGTTKMMNESSTVSKGELSDTFVQWSLGNGLLNDFYQNQDQYGQRVDRSFPLWGDQLYVYDKYWNNYYDQINREAARCCRSRMSPCHFSGRPDTTENGYNYHADYYFKDKIKSAHDAYVKKLVASRGCASVLTKPAPETPPKPLAPFNESVIYVNEQMRSDLPPFTEKIIYQNGQLQQTQSEWPEPWKTFIGQNKDKVSDYNRSDKNWNGHTYRAEMATDFNLPSLKLKELLDADTQKFEEQNNRLNVYQVLKKYLDSYKTQLDAAKVRYLETVQSLVEQVTELNADIAALNGSVQEASQKDQDTASLSQLALIPALELPAEFDILNNINQSDFLSEVEKISVHDGKIYYQENPTYTYTRWPEKFDLTDATNYNRAGDLVLITDNSGIGRVHLRTAPKKTQTKFDVFDTDNINQMRTSFNKTKESFIARALGELSLEMKKEQQFSDKFKQMDQDSQQKLTEQADIKSRKDDVQKSLRSLTNEASTDSKQTLNAFIEKALSYMDESNATWPDVMKDSSRATTAELLKALETDKEALTYLTRSNAADVEQLMKESKASRALVAEYGNWRDENDGRILDAQCLNQGVFK